MNPAVAPRETIISTEILSRYISRHLSRQLDDPSLRVCDVRWRLGDPSAGRRLFARSRLPGAVFLDVDRDLSDIGDPGMGRHPLPAPERLVETLANAGIGQGVRVVSYDDAGGMHAARLWWLLGWLGVESSVLDGGFAAWEKEGRPLETGEPQPPSRAARPLAPHVDRTRVWTREAVRDWLRHKATAVVLDARAAERYRGDVEPIDARAGHVPGAKSAPATANLDAAQHFKDRASLRAQFARAGISETREVVCYCGSGVTACHDVLALELAGFSGARLYAGSWSEWSRDPSLPAATGPEDNEDNEHTEHPEHNEDTEVSDG